MKTRLIPALGTEGATTLYRRLLLYTLRTAARYCKANRVMLEIRFDGPEEILRHCIGDAWIFRPQCSGDLGARMAAAIEESAREGACATVIIGSDCPGLTEQVLAAAFETLSKASVVLGPATDGGYYLVGVTRPFPELFRGIEWSTDTVLARSLEILRARHIEPGFLEPLDDLDRPEDAVEWHKVSAVAAVNLRSISVVIPTLNESSHIEATLNSIRSGEPLEMIVVDGGSKDSTAEIASRNGARVVNSRPGRARQMNAGAALAAGDILLFAHGDTRLTQNWNATILALLKQPDVAGGAFAFAVADHFAGRRMVEWSTNLRSRWWQKPYGDQTLFLSRALFEELGGFADLPIMEDYEFNQRLRKRGKVVTADLPAVTSGRRWRKLGVIRTTLTNTLMIAGYHAGVPPNKLASFYRR